MSRKPAEQADYASLEEWEAREPNVAYVMVDGELVEVQPPATAGPPPQGETDANQQPAQVDDVHGGGRPEVRQRRRR
jgi:hypothetical protein